MGVNGHVLNKDDTQISNSVAGGQCETTQGIVFLCCLGPVAVTLVLSKLSRRKLQVIQVFMSVRKA